MKNFYITSLKIFLILTISASFTYSQNNSPSYFKNFVYHSNESFCYPTNPTATFIAYLNGDESNILIENVPRWEMGADPNISGNGTFGVELGNIDLGNEELTVHLANPSNVKEELEQINEFALEQNYPNPFNPVTKIVCQISQVSIVKLKVYDLLGRGIKTRIDEYKIAGRDSVYWNGKDNQNSDVASGVYFYKPESGSNIIS